MRSPKRPLHAMTPYFHQKQRVCPGFLGIEENMNGFELRLPRVLSLLCLGCVIAAVVAQAETSKTSRIIVYTCSMPLFVALPTVPSN